MKRINSALLTAVASGALALALSATALAGEEPSVGEKIGSTSRDVSEATQEGYESSKKWTTETASDVGDATKKGYEASKKWTTETASDVGDATKKGYETSKKWTTETASGVGDATKEGYESAKKGTSDFINDLEKGYEKKSD